MSLERLRRAKGDMPRSATGRSPVADALDLFTRQLVDPRSATVRDVLPPMAWLDDPYYAGNLGSFDEVTGTGCWPSTRRTFELATAPDTSEIIVTGALGTGKTDVALRLIARWLYELSCYASPQRLVGLQDHSVLLFMLIHMNKTKAKRKLYEPLVTALRRIPYFQKEFRWEERSEKSTLNFEKGIVVRFGVTDPEAVRSEDLVCLVMDEANFLDVTTKSLRDKEGRTFDVAEEIYETTVNRQVSRFSGKSLWAPRRVMLSSRDRPGDFLERMEQTIRDTGESTGTPEDEAIRSMDGRSLVVSKALWTAKPPGTYVADTFAVQVGFGAVRTRVLHPGEEPHAGARVVHVPNDPDLVLVFKKNVAKALREIGGVAVEGVAKLFPDPTVLESIWQDDYGHPYSRMITTLKDDGVILWDELVDSPPFRPKCCPEAWRFFHVDTAATCDSLGFACVHIHGTRMIRRQDDHGKFVDRLAPVFRYDLILRVDPPEGGGEIRLQSAFNMVLAFREYGFRVGSVSFDTWQTLMAKQTLEGEGIHCRKVSLDVTAEPYLNWRDAVLEGRVQCYRYPPLGTEARDLTYYRGENKVDHSPRGSKDLADACAGAVAGAMLYGASAAASSGVAVRVEVLGGERRSAG